MEKKKSKLWILHSRPPCQSQLPEIGGSWATSKSRRNSTSSSSDNDEKTSRTEEEEMERNGRRMETTRRRWTERRRLVDSAKHEEINKSTSEAVSWVEKWKKTIDVVGWRRITGAGRRATRERIRNRVVYIYIYICATRSSFSSFSYFLSLWLHSNVRTRKENAFSLSRSRGNRSFLPRAERRPFPEAPQRYSRGKRRILGRYFEHGIRYTDHNVACTCAEGMTNICHDYSASNYGSIEIWESSTLIRLPDRRKCELTKVEGIE